MLFSALLSVSTTASAAEYMYELSEVQTWADAGSSTGSTQYITARAYVSGSNRINFTTIPIYTNTYSSTANSLGDLVGSVNNIYSTSPAWVDPNNEAKYSVMYPTYNVMRTRLTAVNDDRLAVGSYIQVGGSSTSFIYDLAYRQYTELKTLSGQSATLADINNSGQIIGSQRISDITVPFVYDCVNGFQDFVIPGATSTSVSRIDDQGNIYGRVNGVDENMTYFVARPDSLTDTSMCSLVPRDDVAKPLAFGGGKNVEMSGDTAQFVKIGDFNHGGVDDIFVYHEMGKYILYIGEDGFKTKIKNFADWNTVEYVTGVTSATEWDFNNDGLIDKLVGNLLYLAKNDGEYYYVPQTLPVGTTAAYGYFNDDDLLDVASFDGAFVSIAYQASDVAIEPDPVVDPAPVVDPTPVIDPVSVVDPTPVIDPTSVADAGIPAVDTNAYKDELEDTIAEVRADSVLLSSGNVLWFNVDSIIKYNDATAFEIGQTLEFKAWVNSDGSMVGIKVEVI